MKEDKLNLVLTIFRYSLVLIGVGLSILLFSGPTVADGMAAMAEFRKSSKMIGVDYTIIIIGMAIVSVLGFFFYQLMQQPKKTITAIIGIVVSLVIYFGFFIAGSADTNTTLALRHEVSDGVISAATAGIYTIGICLFVGVLAVVFGPLMGRYRK